MKLRTFFSVFVIVLLLISWFSNKTGKLMLAMGEVVPEVQANPIPSATDTLRVSSDTPPAESALTVNSPEGSNQPITALISTAQDSIQVIVPSTAQWVSTGIQVNIGDPITITASGSWTPGPPEYDWVGPDGSSQLWPDNFLNLTDIGACAYCATTPTPHWAALIGYIGENPPGPGSYVNTEVITEARRIFVVGSGFITNVVFAGTLWLNFNDDAYSNATGDNAGEVAANLGVEGGETYAISGRVVDSHGDPIQGVMVSAGSAGSATTNASGYYTISGLPQGEYTLRPSKTGFGFAPEALNITLSGNRTGQNFRGYNIACVVPLAEPFLRFPVDYSGRDFSQIIKDTDEGGLINSWFDHLSPLYTANYSITLYTGNSYSQQRTGGPFFGNLYCYDRRCYDGHNGIDIVAPDKVHNPNSPILAAAEGTVVRVCNDANICGPLGKQVWIDHGNNYATLYAHLNQINVTVGQHVVSGQQIGVMGSTGASGGTHLHFGLYFNYNLRDPWITTTVEARPDEVVDPFGGPGQNDPWGTPSVWLWQGSAGENRYIGQSGGSLSTPNVTAVFPAGSVYTDTLLSLTEGPVARASAQLRHVGLSFLLRILSGSGGSGGQSLSVAAAETLSAPMTITASYANASLRHLDPAHLAPYYYDETMGSWAEIDASVNPSDKSVTFQTDHTGDFSLQSPLLCPAESQEPDDHYMLAEALAAPGAVSRLIDIADDEDWFTFEAMAGQQYALSTVSLANGVKPMIRLYDTDGVTLLASAEGWTSTLQWQAPAQGKYFIQVLPAGDSIYGCEATYTLSLSEAIQVYLPLVLRGW